MFSEIIREEGEIVTVVRLSADKDEESIIANEIACVIDPVEGQHEHWLATLANTDVREGDILRRDNGSDLQVLRAVRDPMGEDITDLDLKDYNRQEPPLQENEVGMSKSDLPEHEFHPAISLKVWSFFSQGAYDTAVLKRSNRLRSPSERQGTILRRITGFL